MNEQQIADLMASTPLAWIVFNKFVNENQQTVEFTDHRFLIDIYADESDDIVCKKSAQVGYSVLAILKCLWILKYRSLNVLYVLPTQNLMKDFVVPKVNPLIYSNPAIKNSLDSDRENLKSINKRFLFFGGAASEREAISKTADVLVLDEYDRMPDFTIVNMFDSRLQASKHPRRWRFSNPSQVGFGVDELYANSDQRHWFVTCHSCGHRGWMDWETNDQYFPHYVDRERKIYACGKCNEEITDQDRRMGEWIARFPKIARHGYWINQMMAPWVSAERILEQHEESGIEFFYNFVLGKAYTPSDMVVNRESILRATSPSNIARQQVAIGVDQDAGGQYFVAMTPQGVFDYGYVDSWDKIEHMKLMYNAVVVCDPNPYSATPKQMAGKYRDWYLCYFKNLDTLSAVQWKEKEQVVYADRTRAIDIVANEINAARVLFRLRPHELESYIAHWKNLYRTTEEKEDGRIRSVWIKKEERQSDYPFAHTYARIGLSKMLGSDSTLLEPEYELTAKTTINTVNKDGSYTTDMTGILEETFAEMNDEY